MAPPSCLVAVEVEGATSRPSGRLGGVAPFLHLTPLDADYPSRLRTLVRPPASITVRGGALEAPRTVAIVGSREPDPEAKRFAGQLAAALSRCGVVVVSGGAFGIDAAAHRGALDAGGRTWGVPGTGCDHCFPPEHADLYESIGAGPGAMLWPFAPSSGVRAGVFLRRNRVLVALSDAVVVVQAGFPSGALAAAERARAARKPLWVVPAPPWLRGFEGSRLLLDAGARPLTSEKCLLRTLELGSEGASRRERHPSTKDPFRSAVLSAVDDAPLHLEEIATRTHLTVQATAVALLTLALEAVVVEGPPGFFRRAREL
jgi:DNA processing protein